MAIKTDEDLERVFGEVIEEVVVAMSDRVQKRLRQFISKDVYGLSMNANFAMGKINKSYLDGTGTPSYEFRDQAWDVKYIDDAIKGFSFSLVYDALNMTPPSSSSPYLHGNYYGGRDGMRDRREILAEVLNVNGIDSHNDWGGKKRKPYWDDFLKDLNQNIGGWLYTEFNKRGIKIPALKLYKGSFIG